MSDPLDAALRGLRGQRPPAPFAPPDAVRRRGRQRSTHQAVAAGVAVLTVVGGTAGWLSAYGQRAAPDVNPPGATTAPPSSAAPGQTASPSPTPGATGTPSPIGSLDPTGARFLQPADLGAGNWTRMPNAEIFSGGKSYWSPQRCPIDREHQHPTAERVTDFNGVAYRSGENVMKHAIELYPSGAAATRLDEIQAQLVRCSRATTAWPQDNSAPTRFIVTPLDGIGDEAFLVRSETWTYPDGRELSKDPTFFELDVVLRVGDRVATVNTSIMDERVVRTLAANAAERLG